MSSDDPMDGKQVVISAQNVMIGSTAKDVNGITQDQSCNKQSCKRVIDSTGDAVDEIIRVFRKLDIRHRAAFLLCVVWFEQAYDEGTMDCEAVFKSAKRNEIKKARKKQTDDEASK